MEGQEGQKHVKLTCEGGVLDKKLFNVQLFGTYINSKFGCRLEYNSTYMGIQFPMINLKLINIYFALMEILF